MCEHRSSLSVQAREENVHCQEARSYTIPGVTAFTQACEASQPRSARVTGTLFGCVHTVARKRGVHHWPVWRTIFRNTRIPSIRPWIPVFCQGFPYSRWIPVFRMDSCIFRMDSCIFRMNSRIFRVDSRIRYGFRIPSMGSSDSYGFYGRSLGRSHQRSREFLAVFVIC